jgi:phosphoenolpyruvate synthase/pyruvate phosphate dikinase
LRLRRGHQSPAWIRGHLACGIRANGIRESNARLISVWQDGQARFAETGETIQKHFSLSSWPTDLGDVIRAAYGKLAMRTGVSSVSVAMRSNAAAEDLPDLGFAGELD